MRSQTSRGVPEWSGGEELYIGSPVSAPGMFRGSPVLYRDHRKGPGGPPGGATYPGGPHGLKWEGNQPLVGWCTPLGPPPAPRVGNPRGGGHHACLGGRTSPPGAGSPPTSAHGALWDRWPHPVDPRDPSGGPGTIPITPETFLMAENGLPIYKSLPLDHSGTPRDVRDLIRDSEQLSGYRMLISQQP